jgi:hypothetical protein
VIYTVSPALCTPSDHRGTSLGGGGSIVTAAAVACCWWPGCMRIADVVPAAHMYVRIWGWRSVQAGGTSSSRACETTRGIVGARGEATRGLDPLTLLLGRSGCRPLGGPAQCRGASQPIGWATGAANIVEFGDTETCNKGRMHYVNLHT